MGVTELLQQVMTLTSNVGRLQADVDRLDDILRAHADRISKLENASDLTVEKARNAAIMVVTDMQGQLVKSISRLEHAVGSGESGFAFQSRHQAGTVSQKLTEDSDGDA